ncbi:hypothetical protein FRC09_002580, partial [Ceratobasidium sp. 395]
MSHRVVASQIHSDEIYLLRPPGSTGSASVADTPHPSETKSWRSGVTTSFIVLVSHAVLGLAICAAALYFTFNPDYTNRGWFALYSFGPPLPLLTARYLNFGLDICARVLSITLEFALAFVALRTATILWSSSRGIKISDALTFNFIQLEVASIPMMLQTKASWRTRISYVFSIICGIAVYLSGSLMFGYENTTVQKSGDRNIRMGGNQMFLGSNASGSHVAPDYSSLVHLDGSTSPFTSTVLHTLMDIDLSQWNESISSFDLSVETRASLSSRNITTPLVKETVSTRLTECQPLSSNAIQFGFHTDGNSFVTYVEQNISGTTGATNQLREELYTYTFWFTASKYQTFTFVMTHAAAAGATSTPIDESEVIIVLAYKGMCLPDPFATQFGPMPHVRLNQSDLFFPHNHAVLSCRNVRTISRIVYAPDGNQIEQNSQSFYAKPVLSTLNRIYMYFPVVTRFAPFGQILSRYGGIGSLLNREMIFSSTWMIPSCSYGGNAPAPENSTTLDAISAAWSQAVTRLQHYETSALQALIKQNTTFVSTPVLIATPAYRLAVMPGALFIYGLAMAITACVLLVLLAIAGDNRRRPL